MPTPRKIERGQKLSGLPAASWNAFVDTYNRVRQMPPRGNGTGASSPLGPVLVEVKNDSGGAVAAGGILKIDTPIITPSDRAAVVYEGLQFVGDTPDGSGTVAILQEPLDDGAIGVGVIPGASWARVNVTDAGHGFALATAATTTLQSDPSAGLPVLWKPSGTGEKWCVILLHSTAAGNVILASVNGDVDSGDPTGLFDGAVAIVGEIPPGGSGTFINEYQQEYADNDLAILLQRQDNGDWYAERGGTAGSIVVTYELTQDMAYADTAKLAKPVDETGAIISAADAFYVLDEQEKFYGKSGYQGIALKTKNDHSGGVPGYRIITMEGPAQLLTGVLAGSYSTSGTSFTPSVDEIWGRPHRGRREPAEGSITVYDDLDVASDAKTGDKWLIGWDESEEHYIFIVPLKPTLPHVGLHFGMVTSDIAAASMDGTLHTATPGIQSGAVVLLQWNSGRTALEPMLDADDDELIVKGVNLRKTAFRAGTSQPIVALGQVYGDISNATDALNAHFVLPQDDLRSLPNFDPAATQFPGFLDSDTDAAKLETLEYWLKELGGWTAGNLQSIGHDASTDPAWQDDDDECPA